MKLNIIFYSFIILYFINLTYGKKSYLIFPLKKVIINNKISDESLDVSSEILKVLIPNNIFLTLKIGSSMININCFLTFSQSFLSIGEKKCLFENDSIINITDSFSYNIIDNVSLFNMDKRKYERASYFKETIIYSNNSRDIKIENMNCFSYINEQITKCSIFGLDLNRDKNKQNLFKAILEKNNLSKSYFSIIFNNDYHIFQNFSKNDTFNYSIIDGEILLGIPPHQNYKDKFLEKELIEINTQCSKDYLSWMIRFDQVYIENTKNNSIKYFSFNKMTYYDIEQYFGIFTPEVNPIFVPNSIFDYYISNYFNKYLNKECIKRGRPLYNNYLTNNDFKKMQIFVYCYKNKILNLTEFYNEFPSLYLKNSFFKEIFTFKGKELFLEDNNYIYFMLLPEFTKNNKFLLGKMFMKKYQFTFNYDTKTIGYYNKNLSFLNNDNISNNNNNNYKNKEENYSIIKIKYILIFFIVLFLLLLGIGIIYCGKCFYKNNKYEKEALELSYMKKEDDSINNNKNLI